MQVVYFEDYFGGIVGFIIYFSYFIPYCFDRCESIYCDHKFAPGVFLFVAFLIICLDLAAAFFNAIRFSV